MSYTLDPNTLIVIGIVVLVVAVLIGWWLVRQRKSRRLRQDFGPEYERQVETAGGRSEAEHELEERRRRVEKYELRELGNVDRERLASRWREIQKLFVDQPGQAVGEAAELIGEAMELRGYPVAEIRQKEADLSVHYPSEVQDYRKASAIASRNRRGEATTEELRQAAVDYRNLFEHLVGLDGRAHKETTS